MSLPEFEPGAAAADNRGTPVPPASLPVREDRSREAGTTGYIAEAIMVIIMEMHTGNVVGNPDEYGDEVLNASWLPQPEPALPLQHVERGEAAGNRPPPPIDVDDFLRAVYRYQE